MLNRLHALFKRLGALSIPTVAVVRGACLGGGLELAGWCSWLFASPEATFGQPEIRLGVFPPIASLLLPWRIGGGRALDLCVSGRVIDVTEARACGLVHEVADDPAKAAAQLIAELLLPRSASSLRFAERAARLDLYRALDDLLPDLERLYLEELMRTHDANEGIAAFLEKRLPRWSQP
jgi:cyclohexa-1,5-dienecarbonyl-CoA hydratase